MAHGFGRGKETDIGLGKCQRHVGWGLASMLYSYRHYEEADISGFAEGASGEKFSDVLHGRICDHNDVFSTVERNRLIHHCIKHVVLIVV
tara:strand:- start:651 stop:920 length:270 start_codon:yes stop_codon:yes gene_type:complete